MRHGFIYQFTLIDNLVLVSKEVTVAKVFGKNKNRKKVTRNSVEIGG